MSINEVELKDYPKPIFCEQTKIILRQMKTCICKININGNRGSGFFTKISMNDKMVPVFITNYHIINKDYLHNKDEIEVIIYDELKKIYIKNKAFYFNQEYDVTIIEVDEEKEKISNYLELDENIFNENRINEYIGNTIYILQYPSYHDEQKLGVSYGIIKNRFEDKEYNFIHYCSTEYGSSGSPILNINNNKIIGIHKQRSANYNIGSFLYYSLKEFKNLYENKKCNKINVINKNNTDNIYTKGKTMPAFYKEIQPVIKTEIQPVIKTEIQPIIHKIIQPVHQTRNKKNATNLLLLCRPKSKKKIITIEYPISDMDRKYFQNIDLTYIEKCFEKAEQEFYKKNYIPQRQSQSYIVVNESKINEVPKSPFLSTINIKNPKLETIGKFKNNIIEEEKIIKQPIIQLTDNKEMKIITNKIIEIIIKDI